ncbi:tetratricopeptide repeat protein 22 isoform X1 [Polypterus senegalus]
MGEEGSTADIEQLISEMDFIPGHFSLALNVNFEFTVPTRLRHRDIKLKRDSLRLELESEVGPQQYAIRHLLGLFAFHLDDFHEAEDNFASICKEDPHNLNAWANLGFVYDKLRREAEGAECVDKVSALMGLREGGRLLSARCLAEQAYAYAYDVGLSSEQERAEKLRAAIGAYDKAIEYGGQEIPIEEKRSWHFSMAAMMIRLDGILGNQKSSERVRGASYGRALKLLRDAIKSSNLHHRALTWCYIGVMLERQESFLVVPMAVHDEGFTCTDPLDCYYKAIELAKEDPFILNRLAKVFLFIGKHDMATGVCNMALDILANPELNWQAYSTRAKVHITAYVRDLERVKLGFSGVPDRENLSKAKTDLENIVEVHPCLKTHLDIGQVYYYMGVDALQERHLVDEAAINKALVFLSKALEDELGDVLPEIHLLRGKCLLLKSEEENAAECFKRAVEMDDGGQAESFRGLLEALLALYSQRKAGAEAVIAELEEWLGKAEEKYPLEQVRRELQAVCRSHTAEVSDLSRAMIRAGKLDLVRLLLSTVEPRRTELTRSLSL